MITAYTTENTWDNRAVRKHVDVLHYINNPAQSEMKQCCPMWGFLDGELPVTENKEAVNWNSWTALLLDYDDGAPIREVQEFCNEWFHFGYTSYSHTPEEPRFRVILPFDAPQSFDLISCRCGRDALTDFFTGVDPSSFTRGRMFYQPAVNPQRFKDYYRWRSSSNIHIDTTEKWLELVGLIEDHKEEESKFSPTKPVSVIHKVGMDGVRGKMYRRSINRATEYVDETLSGCDFHCRGKGQGIHNKLLSCNSWMYHHGVDEEDRLGILMRYSCDERTQREIENIVTGYNPECECSS